MNRSNIISTIVGIAILAFTGYYVGSLGENVTTNNLWIILGMVLIGIAGILGKWDELVLLVIKKVDKTEIKDNEPR
jgi:VIT1/CCC1 family predicted Fe2+/Mn2+ transporter